MAFVDVLCPACAGKIRLHSGVETAYCTLCGDCISLEDARNGKINEDAIDTYTADELYAMAQDADNNPQLLYAAAEKGSIDANLFIGVGLVTEGEYERALSYLKVASDAESPNGMAMYAATLLDAHNNPDDYDRIVFLMDKALKLGCDDTVAGICKSHLEEVRPIAQRNRRVRRMEEEYRAALQANDFKTIERLAKEGHAESIDLVQSVERRLICRYYQNGLCTKQSTSYYLAHCDDPRKAWCPDYRQSD